MKGRSVLDGRALDWPTPPDDADQDDRRQAICRMLLQAKQLRITGLNLGLPRGSGSALAPNPYLEILLALYLAELEGRSVYQSSLGGSGPPATVHRQAARLEQMGAIARSADLTDQRRLNIALTRMMRAALDRHIDALDALIAAFRP